MPETTLNARSAIEREAAPRSHGKGEGEPGVTLREIAGLALATVIARKGEAKAAAEAAKDAFGIDLPVTPRRVERDGIAFLWAGPEQWLAVAGPGRPAGQFENMLAGVFDGHAAVTEQSDGRTIIRISGPNARDALAKGLPIDLHPRAFKPGDTALTLAAHIGLQIWQIDEAPTYEIAVFRGFARSFWHFLLEAAAENGCRIEERG
jgi:heterotetrameric sarcosine oxidase gamma subunit